MYSVIKEMDGCVGCILISMLRWMNNIIDIVYVYNNKYKIYGIYNI